MGKDTSKLPAQEQRLASWGTRVCGLLKCLPVPLSGSQKMEMGRKFTLTTELGFPGHGGGDLHLTSPG